MMSKGFFDYTKEEKNNKPILESRVRCFQKKLSRQKKGSKAIYKTKIRLSSSHRSIINIRENFWHQISRKIVDNEETKVIGFKDLKTKQMTKKPKAKKGEKGNWLKNNAIPKAGLNKAILDKNWHLLETFTNYKAKKVNKQFFKVGVHYISW